MGQREGHDVGEAERPEGDLQRRGAEFRGETLVPASGTTAQPISTSSRPAMRARFGPPRAMNVPAFSRSSHAYQPKPYSSQWSLMAASCASTWSGVAVPPRVAPTRALPSMATSPSRWGMAERLGS